MRMPCRAHAATVSLGLLVLIVFLIAGCSGIGTLQADATEPGEDESVLVFGVKPASHGIMFFPGSYEADKFRAAQSTGVIDAVISQVPRDGYVVARAKAGQVLALMVVNAPKSGASGGQYHACGGSRALVVEVPKGRVAYVADIEFTAQGSKLDVRYSHRLDAAREHLRRKFPRLKSEAEFLDPQMMATANECVTNTPGTITIPIYLGR